MKKAIFMLALAIGVLGCTRVEYDVPQENGVKYAEAYTPSVTVDQETNQVTFSVDGTSVVPVWVFQDKGGEWSEYHPQNGYKKIFTSAGDYTVRMYVMNANGLSPDYVTKTFHIDNSIVNFDRYIRYISGGSSKVWRIDNAVAGHQACGGSVGNPTEWWAAQPDEKKDFGMYDNRLTFTSDGAYTFDPGEAGTVYVHNSITSAPYGAYKEDSDYVVPVSAQTTTYAFAVEGDDLFLTLPAGTLFPYLPNEDYLKDSKFYLISLDNNAMTLVWYTPTGNDGGPIAWQFILTSKEGEVKEDPLYGAGTKTWKMAAELPAHMGCGPDMGNPVGWWSAAPNEKADFGVYDNRLTFASDGTYTFDPGEDGLIYVNWGCKTVDGQEHAEPDFTFAWEKQEGKYSYDGVTITLPANFTIGYIPNDDCFANPEFIITELTDEKLVLVSVISSIAWQFIFVPADSAGPDTPDEPGGGLIEGENLWATADVTMAYWYSAAADWEGKLQPAEAEILPGNGLRVVMPDNFGGAEWKGQNAFHAASLPASKDEEYDFWMTLEADQDMTLTVKLAWEGNDKTNEFFYDNAVTLTAGKPFKYVKASISPDMGKDERNDYDGIVLFVDTGRSPSGSEIKMTDIHFQKHIGGSPDQPDEPERDYTTNNPDIDPAIFDIEGEGNLWRKAEVNFDYWYSASDWSGLLAPVTFPADDWAGLKIIVPEGIGGNEWQGQSKWHTDIAASKDVLYDFCFTVKSDEDIQGLTVKLAWEGNDNDHAFFYVNDAVVKAGVPYQFRMAGIAPDVDYDKVALFIDLGRAKAGTAVSFTDFCLQENAAPVSYGENLWGTPTMETWFSPSDWSGGLDPQAAYADGKLTLTVPDGVGGGEWQGQVKLTVPVAVSPEKQYDFSCKILADTGCTVTVKLADANDDSNHAFFYDNAVALTESTALAYKKSPVSPDQEYTATMLIFDFGRAPAGTLVTVSDIVLREIL